MFHWTDSKIQVHAFYCVLGISLLQYIHKRTEMVWPGLSMEQLLEQLGQIQQFTLLYPPQGGKGPNRLATVLSKQTLAQQSLAEVLGLNSGGRLMWAGVRRRRRIRYGNVVATRLHSYGDLVNPARTYKSTYWHNHWFYGRGTAGATETAAQNPAPRSGPYSGAIRPGPSSASFETRRSSSNNCRPTRSPRRSYRAATCAAVLTASAIRGANTRVAEVPMPSAANRPNLLSISRQTSVD